MEKGVAPKRYQFFLFITLIVLPGCVHRRHIDKQKLYIDTENVTVKSVNPPSITIWVHGTLMFYIPVYHQIFVDNSCLLPATALPKDHHFRIIADTIAEHDPEHFPLEEFYIFGWSGKLKNKEREIAAQRLYEEILRVRKNYHEKYGIEPTIRIIAHSHGGNVTLNMCNIDAAPPFTIKSLILVACPVQEKTMHLISTPMFKRVYSLYSSFDIVQVLAPEFKWLRTTHAHNPKGRKYSYKLIPFSARLFPIYSHLTQAKIKIDDYPISHTRFSAKKFISCLPTILQKLDSWHDESLATNKIAKHKLLCVYTNRKH